MIDEILSRLDKVRSTGTNKWSALCPAHNEKTPSLTIRLKDDGRILIHCFGCGDAPGVMDAIGMKLADLSPETYTPEERKRYKERRKVESYQEKLDHALLLLDICQSARESGEKISQADLKKERDAFLTVKKLQGKVA